MRSSGPRGVRLQAGKSLFKKGRLLVADVHGTGDFILLPVSHQQDGLCTLDSAHVP
jgi:hypothetical protein